MSEYLIFVDTNIFLDFYRVRKETGLKLLQEFDNLHDRLITTYQVEMEFKRNRQAVIIESLKNLKIHDKVPHVAFLSESRSAEALNKSIDSSNKKIQKTRERLKNLLANPTRSDPVYKIVQRVFATNTPLNLNRKKKVRYIVKNRAFRRFILGYPPRKPKDTSMGDSLNWEWIVQVSKDTGKNILIISRDSDYGIELDGNTYINDWLSQEFRDRVSKKRQCLLFNRLSPAYKLAGITVSKETEKEEEEEIVRKRQDQKIIAPMLWPEIGDTGWIEQYEEIIRELPRKSSTDVNE